MKRFKNILVVADGDDGQTRSLIYSAMDLARRNGAALTVFSVVEKVPERRRYKTVGGRRRDLVELMIQGRKAELMAATPHSDVPVFYEVVSGTPHIEIIERVNLLGHDLVLTVPMPPIRRIGLGSASTTMHLLRKCPVPVWVHSPLAETADAIVAAIGPMEPESEELNRKLLELSSSLARTTGSELHIVHAWRLEGETMLRSPRLGYGPDEIAEMGSEVRDDTEAALARLVDEVELPANTSIHVRKGHAADVINDMIAEIDPATVVMGTLARSGIPGYIIGNTAERVLVDVNRSVLAVKPDGFVTPIGAISAWDPGKMPY
ncbi:MAG: universal stress protein [Acidimicrobiia bacterium]|nr:universal stress protein [Acidimicrobiia bacterium]